MLVRFNKGPWHRKVREISDAEVKVGVFNVAVYDKKSVGKTFHTAPNQMLMVAPGHKIATYRLKMVKVNLRGQDEWLPSIYPDGAVCYEYEGAR